MFNERLEKALLLTGMMNQRFIDMIKGGEVDEEYIEAAFKNFREAQNPGPRKVEVEYVLGFMFSEDEKKILLIWKNRPAWQAGKLNGIGGKIEKDESPFQAMVREFQEETGFVAKGYHDRNIVPSSPPWKLIGTRARPALFDNQPGSYRMHIFACHYDTAICDLSNEPVWNDAYGTFDILAIPREDTSETIIHIPLNLEILKRRGVPGLAGLVELSLSALRENFMIELLDPVNMENL